MTVHDEDLVARFLRASDEDAFRQLYRRHTPALYLLALRLLGPRGGEAEDVVQETWVRAARNLRSFAWSSSLRTWLCGIVVNRCREVARRGRREQRALSGWPDGVRYASAWPARTLAVERAIAALPDGRREVLVLHDICGYTHAEIGRMLEISEGTSKSQLHDARRSLQQSLAGLQPAGSNAHD